MRALRRGPVAQAVRAGGERPCPGPALFVLVTIDCRDSDIGDYRRKCTQSTVTPWSWAGTGARSPCRRCGGEKRARTMPPVARWSETARSGQRRAELCTLVTLVLHPVTCVSLSRWSFVNRVQSSTGTSLAPARPHCTPSRPCESPTRTVFASQLICGKSRDYRRGRMRRRGLYSRDNGSPRQHLGVTRRRSSRDKVRDKTGAVLGVGAARRWRT